MKKSIFSIENACIPQLFLLDKLVSGQGLKCKKKFLTCYSLSKNRSKKRIEKSDILKIFFFRKNPKTQSFYFRKSLIGGWTLLFRCHLDMGCMGHGRKKYSKFVSKIPIFTYSTLVHLDSTSNHSKSCRGLFFVHSVQF